MRELEDHYWWFVGRRLLALQLLRMHSATQPMVLDLGCGTGAVSHAMDEFARTSGLDFNLKALAYCRDRGLKNLTQGDAQRLPYQIESFDAVTALDVFEHLKDDETAFDEVFRILRPGGVLVLSVPAFKTLWGPHDVALHHFRRYRRSEVSRKLEDAGFEIVKNSYSVFFLFPLVALSRLVEKLKHGPAKASLPIFPKWLNRLLIGIQSAEANLIVKSMNLPWGSSVVAVARKPDSSSPTRHL